MPQKDLYYSMERIGTTMRAKTYSNFVCFDISVSQKYFKEAFDIISQLLSKYDWTEQFLNRNYFIGTKLNMPIMGSTSTVENLTINRIRGWKKKYFTSNNVCCILTGNFTDDNYNYFIKKLSIIEKSICQIPVKRPIIPKSIFNRNSNSDIISESHWDISDISVTFDIDINRNNIYCVDLMCSILGEGVGSKISMILREQEFLTDEINSKVDIFTDVKRITIDFSVLNVDIEKSLTLFFTEISSFKNNITQYDLNSSITFFTENQKFIYDSPREYNFFLGRNGFILGENINIDTVINQYSKITIQELTDVSNSVLSSKNLIVTITNNTEIYKKEKLKKLLKKLRDMLDGIS
jgi:predicted Zn-dependent peptidase